MEKILRAIERLINFSNNDNEAYAIDHSSHELWTREDGFYSRVGSLVREA